MSDAPVLPRSHPLRTALIGGGLVLAALGGAGAMHWWAGNGAAAPTQPAAPRTAARPIVQIVRQQPGLPDLADAVDGICPAAALLVPSGSAVPAASGTVTVPAVRVSDDGWLLTAAAALPKSGTDAVFGDGQRAGVGEVRTDPVSGLAIVRVAEVRGTALDFSDQPPPRVGQFVLAVATPAGTGCTSDIAMVQSDFLTDGGSDSGYFRLQQTGAEWPAGLPIFAADGRVVGVVAPGEPASTALPASLISLIVDELLRDSLSPTVPFGFRAVDFAGRLATRLGDLRSGAGVALVQAGSAADEAGLEAGDIVTSVNGTPVSGSSELGRALDASKGKVTLTVQRRDETRTVTVGRT